MSFTLYFHPFASYCQKVLVALYELDVPFTPHLVDLGDAAQRAAFHALSPLGKFPLLREDNSGKLVTESTIVIEYVDARRQLFPAERAALLECRARDRFFDLDVSTPMQKLVTDHLRPEGRHDPHGVEEARARLETAYGMLDEWLRVGPWALGDAFTLADCAAAPALLYANEVLPFGAHARVAQYFERLSQRPSFARVMAEAEPYWKLFPVPGSPRARA